MRHPLPHDYLHKDSIRWNMKHLHTSTLLSRRSIISRCCGSNYSRVGRVLHIRHSVQRQQWTIQHLIQMQYLCWKHFREDSLRFYTTRNEMRIPERDWVLSVYLLTLIHRYPLNQNCFRFRVYLWISVSKQTDKRARSGSSRSGILISWWVSCICCCRPCFYINLYAVCKRTCSNDSKDKQGVLKLMVEARVTSYLRLLALSTLTCSPNMSFLSRLV